MSYVPLRKQERAGKSEYEEMMIEAASLEEKLAWLAALNAHTNYVENSLRIAMRVEAQASKDPATTAGEIPACFFLLLFFGKGIALSRRVRVPGFELGVATVFHTLSPFFLRARNFLSSFPRSRSADHRDERPQALDGVPAPGAERDRRALRGGEQAQPPGQADDPRADSHQPEAPHLRGLRHAGGEGQHRVEVAERRGALREDGK